MTQQEFDDWAEDFAAFHARFASLFLRSESREQMRRYLRGLLASVARKNGWQIAEAVGNALPDPTQRLLYRTLWEADAARDRLQAFIVKVFGDPEGIGILDETGFLKKGEFSVGVQRQYTGTAGKIANCQVGVFLAYVTSKGHALLDRRLYLPKVWCEDAPRREHAKVPESVRFQTKPEQGIDSLRKALKRVKSILPRHQRRHDRLIRLDQSRH
jgi:SRSO17 transposase